MSRAGMNLKERILKEAEQIKESKLYNIDIYTTFVPLP